MPPPSPATVTSQADARRRSEHLRLVADLDAEVWQLQQLAQRVGVSALFAKGLEDVGLAVEALREKMEGA